MGAKSKTMVSLEVCASEPFLDCSHEAQALYLHVNVNADSYGVVVNPSRLLRGGGFSTEALDELISIGYVARFSVPLGTAIVILHYWTMNKLDRANLTISEYHAELSREFVFIGDNRVYVPVSSIEGEIEAECESAIKGINSVTLKAPACYQSVHRLNADTNRKERKGIEEKRREENRTEEEDEGEKRGRERPCPVCGYSGPAYDQEGGYVVDCLYHGTLSVDEANRTYVNTGTGECFEFWPRKGEGDDTKAKTLREPRYRG